LTQKKKPEIYAPHIPAGIIETRRLRELLDILEKRGAKEAKITGELIFVLGEKPLSEEEKGILPFTPSRYEIPGVRGIKVCSATTFCNRNHQDVLSLALELDKKFYGLELLMKLTVGLSGCVRSCSEPATKDIGVMAQPQGYKILIGGNAGMNPSIAKEFTTLNTQEEVVQLVGKIVDFCKAHGRKMVRLGKLIEEKGEDFFREYCGSPQKT
jgi:NAD(P)H-nitrite reductase large subunit